ncbi:MAG: curlin repeat-containing protein, partial [Alcanivorax sp.]|nr:curlin repeat-containing protein [Alcanivorax sp.]
MKTLIALLFFVCIPSLAQDLSLPLQVLLSDRSVGSLLAHEHNNRIDLSQLGNRNYAELSQNG